jgi:hypothetical protein
MVCVQSASKKMQLATGLSGTPLARAMAGHTLFQPTGHATDDRWEGIRQNCPEAVPGFTPGFSHMSRSTPLSGLWPVSGGTHQLPPWRTPAL